MNYFCSMPSVYFQTFGCQMNTADSNSLLLALANRGWHEASSPEAASLIIVNTCSVREHAEARARARIAEIAAKKRRPAKHPAPQRLWVIGCMAERLGTQLKESIPAIDAVIGAPELADPEAVLMRHLGGSGDGPAAPPEPEVSEFFPVMRGCNNFCAYCIVPFVRGPETSVKADRIVAALTARAAAGVREVTLLGQNVNSYSDNGLDFPGLLRRVAAIDGLSRIRFLTSHPKDCTEELIRAMAENTGLCRHIHLPVQAGSDRILSLMNRKYTVARYLSLVSMIRRILPDADITTDLMVGFPSETEEEFAATLALVGEVRFTTAFMFAYSAREGTAAAKLKDDLPRDIKIERLNRLIALQTSITRDLYEGLVGQTAEIMVYGPLEKRGESFLRGQDRGCKRVLVRGLRAPPGTVLTAQIVRSSGMTLIAERE
jgi:tRNA-2-methylthio-N6-dimethylallyladenosine synthase